MAELLQRLALRLLLCLLPTYLLWRSLGAIGVVVGVPLFGLALATPLLDLMRQLRQQARAFSYRDIEGRHFAFRGQHLDIVDDAEHFRWIKLSDVRKLIQQLPGDETLCRLYPADVQSAAVARPARIRAEALHGYLAKASAPGNLKFKHWLEREVLFPASQRRTRAPRAAGPDAAPALPDPAFRERANTGTDADAA
ncbi:hypothetical protein RQP53_13625 [Paucibacter sp. APW11]|uniref:Bro-N domain-containing protein n=1 Tax=Roseateles aquae TaxID=3077235 RepID=A0ABU3PCJ9_9BURK|nr:hypothetical protein [Paucibacter sp. APW11]MDT9000308.1 hypothetical protein [Paucibacter sp. APW11]